ncbi:cytochrome c oxidase assembly protein [Corynebacterium choanae]|uniref:Cytochrome c oxidase caa3 assembly factor n=1 Tax=Corynebacterium choanae TaxID=1862358 RepID=A0A3G6JDC6_9CORY|nr:cytochrome c oxidase assembly protein [Corynebacterium choanae]AZA14154.1 Cytochrome c oxidase caa3 assembly factor [Corynebacterium choanae]
MSANAVASNQADSSPPTRVQTQPRKAAAPRSSTLLLTGFVIVAGIVGAWISFGFLAESLALLGIKDPGILTTAGLPFVRSAALMLAALAGGSFLLSSFFTPPRDAATTDLLHAKLDVDGTLAARTGIIASFAYSMCGFLLVPLYLSDVSGEPLVETIRITNWPIALSQVSTSVAFFAVGVIALITALGAAASNRWCFQPLALAGALAGIVPLGLEGHSATGGDHDFGTNSYLWHLLFFVLWVGGLMALIQHGRRRGTHMDLAVHRYSQVALWSVCGMALSGLLNAAIRLPFSAWLDSGYGLLMLAKFVGIVLLGLFGYWHRSRTIPRIAANPQDHRYFQRVAIGEVLIMAAVVGIAIALSRTPPPPPITPDINTMDIQLGYKLFVEPTIWNVWTMWRFDVAFGTLALLLAAAYIWGVYRLHKQAIAWPIANTCWFLGGCLLLLVTMCSGIGMNIPATFSMHMIGHMILTMGVPPLWVLGAPFTLWDKAIKPGPPGIPGPKEWLAVFTNNPLLKFQMHPLVNTLQFVVLFYILYLTPLYDYAVWEHAGHLAMNTVFIWSGCLYYWELIGKDPKPVERSAMSRGAWLIFSMPFHLFFGIVLIHMNDVLAYDFYANLGLPWEVDLAWDQAVGGGIAWASGQFPLLIIFGALFLQWYREDKQQQQHYDEFADATGDADMAAYNSMLAGLQRSDGAHTGQEQSPAGDRRETKRNHRTSPRQRGKKFTQLSDEEFADWQQEHPTGQ